MALVSMFNHLFNNLNLKTMANQKSIFDSFKKLVIGKDGYLITMEKLIGKEVRLVEHDGVDWQGYDKDKPAYIVAWDSVNELFDVSHSPLDTEGWKASINELELI